MKHLYKKTGLFVCCLCCMFFCGCQKQDVKTEEEIIVAESEIDGNEDSRGEQSVGIGIDTPYGALYYSEEWYDYLRVDILEEDNKYQVDFYADYDTHQFLLFSIIYGEFTEGVLLGNFRYEKNVVPVCLQIGQLEIPEDFPNELIDSVYAMREEVNKVCEQIYNEEHFIKEDN